MRIEKLIMIIQIFHKMPLIETNETHLNYEETGTGYPVILLHPFGGSTKVWQEQIAAFAPDHKTIAVDMRGHGASPGTAGRGDRYTLQLFAEDLDGLVDALGIDCFHLLGASMGGMIAMRYANQHPDKIGKLVLVSSYAGTLEHAEPDFRADWNILREEGIDALIEKKKAGTAYFGKPYADLSPEEQQRADRYFAQIALLGRSIPDYIAVDEANLYKPNQTEDMKIIKRELNGQVLILYGTRDFFAEAQPAMQQAMDAQRETIPDAGHLCWLNNPELFNRRVSDFLRAGEQ